MCRYTCQTDNKEKGLIGMFAAAEALELALTAQLSRLQYEGLSINTARTKLSDEANQLSNTLVDQSVPTPPSITDYTTPVYSFQWGTDVATIDTIRPTDDNNGRFNVTVRLNQVGYYMFDDGDYRVKNDGDTFIVGDDDAHPIRGFDVIPASERDKYIQAIRNTFPEFSNVEEYPQEAIESMFKVYVEHTDSSARMSYRFMIATDLQDIPDGEERAIRTYTFAPNGTYEIYKRIENCELEFDTTGRITEIGIPNEHESRWRDYSVSTATTTDQSAYEDAYNHYEHEKYIYEQEQREIEMKIKVIERQEKSLELQLARIENNANAIKQQLEGVKNILKDGAESFKTFSG